MKFGYAHIPDHLFPFPVRDVRNAELVKPQEIVLHEDRGPGSDEFSPLGKTEGELERYDFPAYQRWKRSSEEVAKRRGCHVSQL